MTVSEDAPILVACAAPGEAGAISRAAGIGLSAMEAGQTHDFRYADREMVLLLTGVGPLNAASSLSARLAAMPVPPAGVLNPGIAGSFDLLVLPMLQAAVVQTEIYPDFGLYTEEGIIADGIGFAQSRAGGRPVFDEMELDPDTSAVQMGLNVSGMFRARALTVNAATGFISRAESLELRYRAHVENMEGFALAMVAHRFRLPFLEVRTISNPVGSRVKSEWDVSGALSALGQVFRRLFNAHD